MPLEWGITWIFVTLHLLYRDAGTKDRMLRLSEHLISQRSYFPVYPPNSDFNLDLELNEVHSAMTSSSPHLMLISSNFNQFVKVGFSFLVVQSKSAS